MTLAEIKDILRAEVLSNRQMLDKNFETVKASDLMSDVLAFAEDGALLLTGLTNTQVIRTCEIIGISGVVFVRGKKPRQETIKMSEECEIPVLITPYTMFEACGLLYARGLKPSTNSQNQ